MARPGSATTTRNGSPAGTGWARRARTRCRRCGAPWPSWPRPRPAADPRGSPAWPGGLICDSAGQGALPLCHAFCPAAPYLAALTDPSLARLPLVTGGLFCCRSRTDQLPRETMTAAESAERTAHYDPRDIQEKWQARWDRLDLFRASDDPDDTRPRTYLLDMFPYPSGDLHMGHAEAYAIADAVARYYFQRGHNVLHPIGWDAFGLPAENAAIRKNSHPADWTYANIEVQAASFRRYAVSFDWSRRLQTCDPEYYRWNQWLFLRFNE